MCESTIIVIIAKYANSRVLPVITSLRKSNDIFSKRVNSVHSGKLHAFLWHLCTKQTDTDVTVGVPDKGWKSRKFWLRIPEMPWKIMACMIKGFRKNDILKTSMQNSIMKVVLSITLTSRPWSGKEMVQNKFWTIIYQHTKYQLNASKGSENIWSKNKNKNKNKKKNIIQTLIWYFCDLDL